MAFIDDLLGIKNVLGPDGRQLPRRYAISFEGSEFTVSDDPQREQTIVKLGSSIIGELQQVDYVLTANNALADPEDIGPADVVRLSTLTSGWAIAGIGVTDLTKRRKILLNTTLDDIGLGGDTTGLPDPNTHLLVPFLGLMLPLQCACEVIWVPPSETEPHGGWRLL